MVQIRRTLALMAAAALLGGAAAQAVPLVAPPPVEATTPVILMDGGHAMSPLALAPAALSPPIVPPPTATVLTYMGFTWNGYSNRDYYGTMVPAPMVPVMDTGEGLVVTAELECVAACHSRALQGCNAMSYYGNLPQDLWPGAKNCYPKRIGACNIPPDSLVKADGRKFIVKNDPACIPPPGTTPMAFAPIIIAPPPPPPPPPGTPVLVDRNRELEPDALADDPFANSMAQAPTSAAGSVPGFAATLTIVAVVGTAMLL